jgi:hypothetical protein
MKMVFPETFFAEIKRLFFFSTTDFAYEGCSPGFEIGKFGEA